MTSSVDRIDLQQNADAVVNLRQAERAANSGDKAGVVAFLQNAGLWALKSQSRWELMSLRPQSRRRLACHNYLFPAFPILFAGGGVLCEQWLDWVKVAYATLMILAGALLAPTLIPLLPPETYIRYSAATHLQQQRIENNELGPMPQLFGDRFEWQEMAMTVGGVYQSLPAKVRSRTAIFGQTKRAPSIFSDRATDYLRPLAVIRIIFCGDHEATPARA
jgi:hypothetical protein